MSDFLREAIERERRRAAGAPAEPEPERPAIPPTSGETPPGPAPSPERVMGDLIREEAMIARMLRGSL